MDRGRSGLAVLSRLDSSYSDPDLLLIAEYDKWKVRELVLTPEKLQIIWEQLQNSRTLYSDMTRGDIENFKSILLSPDTFWMEVVDQDEQLVGVMYLSNVQWIIDADVHLAFFDRQLAEKAPLCRQAIEWLFRNFAYHRLTATIPAIYFATIRLARKAGFKEEGRKQQSQLIGNKWVDEVILGILRSEII